MKKFLIKLKGLFLLSKRELILIGQFYKHNNKDYPCEIIGFPSNLFSHHHSTAEQKLIELKYHGGKKGKVTMLLEEFKEIYSLVKKNQ